MGRCGKSGLTAEIASNRESKPKRDGLSLDQAIFDIAVIAP